MHLTRRRASQMAPDSRERREAGAVAVGVWAEISSGGREISSLVDQPPDCSRLRNSLASSVDAT